MHSGATAPAELNSAPDRANVVNTNDKYEHFNPLKRSGIRWLHL